MLALLGVHHILHVSRIRVKRLLNLVSVTMRFKQTVCWCVQQPADLMVHYKGKAVPLQAWSGPEGSRKLRFPDFMTMAQDGGKVVSLTHRPPLPQRNAPGTHFCYRLSRPQGHSMIGMIVCQLKIPRTPAGIEPATFWFVAQHKCATAIPQWYSVLTVILRQDCQYICQYKAHVIPTFPCNRMPPC